MFESETDTEVIAKLTKHIYDKQTSKLTFREVVENVVQQLVRNSHTTCADKCTNIQKAMNKYSNKIENDRQKQFNAHLYCEIKLC